MTRLCCLLYTYVDSIFEQVCHVLLCRRASEFHGISSDVTTITAIIIIQWLISHSFNERFRWIACTDLCAMKRADNNSFRVFDGWSTTKQSDAYAYQTASVGYRKCVTFEFILNICMLVPDTNRQRRFLENDSYEAWSRKLIECRKTSGEHFGYHCIINRNYWQSVLYHQSCESFTASKCLQCTRLQNWIFRRICVT